MSKLLKGRDFWNQSAADFSSDQTLGRKFVLDPALLKVIGDVSGKKVLDLGCGYGRLTNLLASKGGICTGIDYSEKLIEIAQASAKNQGLGVDFQVMDATEIGDLEGEFDLILISILFPHLPDYKRALSLARGIKNLAKSDAYLIIGEPHPAFDYYMRNRLASGDFEYFNSGLGYDFKMELGATALESEAYHWTLADYSKLIDESGFLIEKIIESEPLPEGRKINPDWFQQKSKYPSYIIFKCVQKSQRTDLDR